jgi:hypothetical protein
MSDRSRRRCVLRKTAVPDATHYVGYVEDEETPEMIMRKFEEMERIKAAHKPHVQPAGQQQADVAGPSSSSAAVEAAADRADVARQQAAAADGGGQLDQQQLQEIFKATSMYNIKSLLGNNEALMVDAAAKQQADRGPASDLAFNSGGNRALLQLVCNGQKPPCTVNDRLPKLGGRSTLVSGSLG